MTTALVATSYHLGVPALCGRLRGGKVRFLVYHGISTRDRFDELENSYHYTIPASRFEEHLRYLVRSCNVVSLGDVLLGRDLSRTRTNVVLTFDDGYESHYRNAHRLLARHGLPAVFALPTGFVGDGEPLWDDVVEYAVSRSPRDRMTIRWGGREQHFSIGDAAGRRSLYDWLMRECVLVEQERRGALLDSAIAALEVSARPAELFEHEDYRPLSAPQIREMAGSGLVEFASHSVHHYLLAGCAAETLRSELEDSRRQVESLTGAPCRLLALPGGSYDAGVLEAAFRAGYQRVLTSGFGPPHADERVIARSPVSNEHDLHRFADLVHGPVAGLLAAPRRALGAFRARFG